MRDAETLARQAAAQYGLLTTQQLRTALGSQSAVDRFVANGLGVRRRKGVIALVGSPPRWEADLMEVCIASRRLVVASHRSALRLWGMRSVDDDLDVSVRYPANLTAPGVAVHRSRDLSEHDVTRIEALPVTTAARTLCDAGLVFPEREVQRMTEHALAKGIVDVENLWRFRRRVGRRGRNGVGVLERVLDRLPPGIDAADSGPEIAMRRLCDRANLPAPVWQHAVVANGRSYVIDFAYPVQRVAIEYDEVVEHSRPEVFERDRERQNDLIAAGWVVLRFVWSDIRDRQESVARRIQVALTHPTNRLL